MRVVCCAPGPSLPSLVDSVLRAKKAGWFVIAIQGAYRLLPEADLLYGCDRKWWSRFEPEFQGEKWTCHDGRANNDKREIGAKYGLNLIRGEDGGEFSVDPGLIRYGSNSGFQAVNIAILLGAKMIALAGYDHRVVDGKRHFHEPYPTEWGNIGYPAWMAEWKMGKRSLPDGVEVYNCTPGSALNVFEMGCLDELACIP